MENNKQQLLDINLIYANPDQPRKFFDMEKIQTLAESIDKYGIIQPIAVIKKPYKNKEYMIIAGERRFTAACKLNIEQIPCIIKNITIKQVAEVSLIENIQRENLNPIEEALAYNNLIEKYKMSQLEVGLAVGKSRPYISNMLRLLKLTKPVKKMVETENINAGQAIALLKVKDSDMQIKLANKMSDENISVRQSEQLVKNFLGESKTKNKSKSKKAEKDLFIMDIEEKLRNIYNTKVNIISKKNKGKIEIEFYSLEDLEDLLEMLLEDE